MARRWWAALLAAPAAAAACAPLALLMPSDVAAGAIAEAFLLTLPAWLLLVAPLPAALVARRTGRLLVPALVALGSLAVVLAPRAPGARAHAGPGSYALVSANTLAWVDGAGEIAWFLSSIGADAVATIERRNDDIPGMVRVADNYSDDFKVSQQIALFCREGLACQGHVSERYGHQGCVFPVGTLRIEGEVCLVALHAPPPIRGCVEGRDDYLGQVAPHLEAGRIRDDWGACRAGDPAVLMGDLNAVPGSALYRGLRERGFSDALPWQGPRAASWPAGGNKPPLPFFRLDHGLPGAVSVIEAKIIPLPRSDHRGVWLEIGRP